MPPHATILLSRSDVRQLLSMEAAIAAVEAAFTAHGEGRALMPPRSTWSSTPTTAICAPCPRTWTAPRA
nr:hypothetical protein [Polyangium mundeleinium]